jgi:hypothetical protein
LHGKVKGKEGVGKRRISWLKKVRTWFSMTTIEVFPASVNKVKLTNLIANVWNR